MDAIQRLRSKSQANGKLKTTKEQKVEVTEEAEARHPADPPQLHHPQRPDRSGMEGCEARTLSIAGR